METPATSGARLHGKCIDLGDGSMLHSGACPSAPAPPGKALDVITDSLRAAGKLFRRGGTPKTVDLNRVVSCRGCDRPLGERGSPPAVKVPEMLAPKGSLAHRGRCEQLAIRKWVKEREQPQ